MRASDQIRAITTLSYGNQFICYARTLANSSGSAMLFSSGDSPQHASSILSGEGLDEVQPGESPFVVSAVCHLAASLSSPAQRGIKLHRLILGHTCTYPAQRQHIMVTLTTMVEGASPRGALRAKPIRGDGPGGPNDRPRQVPGEDRRACGGRTFATSATAAVPVNPRSLPALQRTLRDEHPDECR